MTQTHEPTAADAAVPTGVQLTALDPAFREDPYPVLDQVREREPVHYDAQLHRYVLTSHDDVDAVVKDRTLGVDPRKAGEGTYMRLFGGDRPDAEPSMLFLDAPDHTRLRSLVTKAFTPRAVESMAPRIEAIAAELLDAVEGQTTFDLIAAYAGPLPVIVIAEMLGVDPADRDDFKRWSDIGVMGFNPLISEEQLALVMQSSEEFNAYLRDAVAARRKDPRDDLMSSLIAAEEAGDQLNDAEIVSMCSLLLAAGNVTTTDLIGNGVLTLLRHPDQLDLLRGRPELMKNAVEEMLRYESPVVQTGRIALEDGVSVGGCPIAKGESLLTSLAAANHDPAVYPDPHRFDIEREDVHHHSFGGGVHYCLGAPLARLEAQIAIGALLRRYPVLRLADEPIEWRMLPAFRGVTKLWLSTR